MSWLDDAIKSDCSGKKTKRSYDEALLPGYRPFRIRQTACFELRPKLQFACWRNRLRCHHLGKILQGVDDPDIVIGRNPSLFGLFDRIGSPAEWLFKICTLRGLVINLHLCISLFALLIERKVVAEQFMNSGETVQMLWPVTLPSTRLSRCRR